MLLNSFWKSINIDEAGGVAADDPLSYCGRSSVHPYGAAELQIDI